MTVQLSPTSAPSIAESLGELKSLLGDRVLLDEEVRALYRSDFGRMVNRLPGAVARCTSAEEVAKVVRFCRERRIPVVARGQAHSQSGQATTEGGVLLDTSSLNTIHEIDEAGETATVDCGVLWRDLVAASLEKGLIPRVLTNNLGVQISGTLSMAGLGVASFRYGAQVDNVDEIEVVTGTGEIVTCSAERNRDLFDVVRCGLGQFGVITRAKIRLRRARSVVRKYYLLYDDLGALMEDAKKVMDPSNPTFSSLESWCTPCLQGIRKIGEGMELGEGMQTFAQWFYPLHLTVELDAGEEPEDAAALAGLSPYRHVHTEDFTQAEFCNRMDPIFELWRRSGYWDMAHPWMETILPWDAAREFIESVLSQTPPQALGPGGHVLLWPAHARTSEAPLFMHPGGEFVMGWGILPAVPARFLERALTQLDMASELSIYYGGKRYLSGYVTFDTAERWAQHFGDRWPRILEAKRKFDPDGIMAPGFIQYE
ncbi:MAG: cytokinin dehydrogenase [Acidobacteriota bacterium]|jgi:FAD/FMN-containing dehydrogenase|nr:cytokinin dehydrogenase [Acidobacteriota bacterium]